MHTHMHMQTHTTIARVFVCVCIIIISPYLKRHGLCLKACVWIACLFELTFTFTCRAIVTWRTSWWPARGCCFILTMAIFWARTPSPWCPTCASHSPWLTLWGYASFHMCVFVCVCLCAHHLTMPVFTHKHTHTHAHTHTHTHTHAHTHAHLALHIFLITVIL